MVNYFLDTDICVEIIRGRAPQIIDRLLSLADDEVMISVITLSELEFGVWRSENPDKNAQALLNFTSFLKVAPFTSAAAATYGRIRAELARKGTPIGPLDTLIAAHAVAANVVLISNNTREFRRIEELHVENWLTE